MFIVLYVRAVPPQGQAQDLIITISQVNDNINIAVKNPITKVITNLTAEDGRDIKSYLHQVMLELYGGEIVALNYDMAIYRDELV